MSRKDRDLVWYQWFYTQDKAICPVCRINLMYKNSAETWHREHILRLSLGGPDTYPNLIPICSTCNLKMGKRCRTTFQYMHTLGIITLNEAFELERKHIETCQKFDPFCEQQQNNGLRCHNLKGGKDEEYCWKHIYAELQPMDTSD